MLEFATLHIPLFVVVLWTSYRAQNLASSSGWRFTAYAFQWQFAFNAGLPSRCRGSVRRLFAENGHRRDRGASRHRLPGDLQPPTPHSSRRALAATGVGEAWLYRVDATLSKFPTGAIMKFLVLLGSVLQVRATNQQPTELGRLPQSRRFPG